MSLEDGKLRHQNIFRNNFQYEFKGIFYDTLQQLIVSQATALGLKYVCLGSQFTPYFISFESSGYVEMAD